MAAFPYVAPSVVGQPGLGVMVPILNYVRSPYADFRQGDIVAINTTGTITNPAPQGAMATFQPIAVPTFGTTTSSGAPAQSLYISYAYTGSSLQSLVSQQYLVNVPAGFEATVTVPTAGQPANTTGFTIFVGNLPGVYWSEVTGTSTGSAGTVPYPLTNYTGLDRAANNASTNVAGIAVNDFDVNFVNGNGGQSTIQNSSLFGADVTGPPIGAKEQYGSMVYHLGTTSQFEIALKQAWYPSLAGTTAGIEYSTTYNTAYLDTSQSNKIVTIDGITGGPHSSLYGDNFGGSGDTGVRVLAHFNSGVI